MKDERIYSPPFIFPLLSFIFYLKFPVCRNRTGDDAGVDHALKFRLKF